MRILKELKLPSNYVLQDIKEDQITVKQLEEMYAHSKSYESLFSKRAKLYKEMGLKDQKLSEIDYKQYILSHYTFLKRPVIISGNSIFIGNSKKTIALAKLNL
jgi:arsenate reductase